MFDIRVANEENSFNGAHFEGADISSFSSKYTRLEGAYIDDKTKLPSQFEPYHIIVDKGNGIKEIVRNYNYNRGRYSDSESD